MKVLQIIYPNDTSIVLNNVAYLQIGIERPHSIPISEFPSYTDFNVILRIQGKEYIVTDRDVLEFGDIYFPTLNIEIVDANNPYLIIDLAYETADER